MQGNRLRERCVHPVSIRNVWIKGTERCLVHHLHFLFCPYSLGPWLRFPHPWEIAFLFFFFSFMSLLNLLQYCFCFMFWSFWPWGMWDLSSLTGDWTHTSCIGRWSLNQWTVRKVLLFFSRPRNSGQGCKMVAKETCALGVPRVPFRSLTP